MFGNVHLLAPPPPGGDKAPPPHHHLFANVLRIPGFPGNPEILLYVLFLGIAKFTKAHSYKRKKNGNRKGCPIIIWTVTRFRGWGSHFLDLRTFLSIQLLD